jgi:phosphinothricin acetyltransferase
MQIREARPDDADAITAIYNDAIANTTAILWHEPKPASLWRNRLTDRPAHLPVLVATDADDRVLGFALLGPYDDKCGYAGVAEWSVYIADHARGQGLGLELSNQLLTQARAQGQLHAVLSRVTEGNTASEHLHAKLGFTKVGTFPKLGEKFGKRYDVIAYQLTL